MSPISYRVSILHFFLPLTLSINISCRDQSVPLRTKNPTDLSWIAYKQEVAAMNQRTEFPFLSNVNHVNMPFYIKTKGVEVRGFDRLPLDMRAYSHNMWIPVRRIKPSKLLRFENILNRSEFYEGLSPGYYQYSLNYSEVAYGCWFKADRLPISYIFVNTRKTLILPTVGGHENWTGLLNAFHAMFNEIDIDTGCIEEDGNQFIQQKTCRDKYLCTMALKYGYDSIQMPSRREFIYCNQACATTRVYGACPPVELRRSDEDNIPCNCSNAITDMNCDNNDFRGNFTVREMNLTNHDPYRPHICAAEERNKVRLNYPIKYSILFQDTKINGNIPLSSLSSSSMLSDNVSNLFNINVLSKSKIVQVILPSMQPNSTIVATQIHPINNNHPLIAFSFSISSTPIGIIGITPHRYSSIHDQTREIIDEIMCLRVVNGTKYQVLIVLEPLNTVGLFDDLLSSLDDYVDIFIINAVLDQTTNPRSP